MSRRALSLKKRMSTFVGCDIGERRLGLLKKAFDNDKDIQSLIKQGLIVASIESDRIWLALTVKGKQHVIPAEKRWSAL